MAKLVFFQKSGDFDVNIQSLAEETTLIAFGSDLENSYFVLSVQSVVRLYRISEVDASIILARSLHVFKNNYELSSVHGNPLDMLKILLTGHLLNVVGK